MEKNLLRNQEGKRITLVGFWLNALLAILKIIAGLVGKSGAMLADGVHSLSDFLTDAVVLVGLKLTDKPADDCHNYGHDKYETLATVIISVFLFIVGFEILKSGAENILVIIRGGQLSKPRLIALVAAMFSIVTKEYLFRYTIKGAHKINSPVLIANAWHHRSDAFSSIGTLVGIGGAILLGEKWTVLDPLASVVVSIFIFRVGLSILKPSIDELMEASLSKEEMDAIETILDQSKNIISYHKLRTRKIGIKKAIEMHIIVEKSLTVELAHEIATSIENKLMKVCGNSSMITIHVEPDVS
ncbi:MAG: cation transporter [Clostridiales bacterium]|nr:cation transporter [Clostridiales bacterium]